MLLREDLEEGLQCWFVNTSIIQFRISNLSIINIETRLGIPSQFFPSFGKIVSVNIGKTFIRFQKDNDNLVHNHTFDSATPSFHHTARSAYETWEKLMLMFLDEVNRLLDIREEFIKSQLLQVSDGVKLDNRFELNITENSFKKEGDLETVFNFKNKIVWLTTSPEITKHKIPRLSTKSKKPIKIHILNERFYLIEENQSKLIEQVHLNQTHASFVGFSLFSSKAMALEYWNNELYKYLEEINISRRYWSDIIQKLILNCQNKLGIK